jgi:hypothetical protein
MAYKAIASRPVNHLFFQYGDNGSAAVMAHVASANSCIENVEPRSRACCADGEDRAHHGQSVNRGRAETALMVLVVRVAVLDVECAGR